MARKSASRKSPVERLCEAMRQDRKELEFYRQRFLEANQDYAGKNWSNRSSEAQLPLNFLDLFVRGYIRNLVPHDPRLMTTIWDRRHEQSVLASEQWANDEFERQNFQGKFGRMVFNALFGVGVAKVHITTPAESALSGYRSRAGTPYLASVDLDDAVWDMHARDFDETAYVGHRFRVPLEMVRDSGLYDKKARQALVPSLDGRYNESGDEKVSHMGRDYDYTDELEDMVDLWSVYVRRTRRMLTLAAPLGHVPTGGHDEVLLRDVEWVGPDDGPFYFLPLGQPPAGSLYPKPPGMDLVFPNYVINNLARKLIGQAGRQKSVAVGRKSNPDDAMTVEAAEDGRMILLNDPEAVRELRYGGPDAANFQLFDYLTGKFDMLAGNLSTMLGLQPLAGTAKQENLLDQNSSRSMADLQKTTISFISKTSKAFMWWCWHHPDLIMRSMHEFPSFPEYNTPLYSFPNTEEFYSYPQVRQRIRSAKFDRDFQMKVDPYSMQFTTPASKASELEQFMMNVLTPLAPVMAPQGQVPDMKFFVERIGRLRDNPDFLRLINSMEPTDLEGLAEQSQPGGGPNGGEYVRRSEGAGKAGPDHVAAMMAAQTNTNGQAQ